MKNFKNKAAFTLAEVLITLGIIGVVAAITIPTMVSNYRKRVVTTKLQRVYSVMNQAIRMSTAENGTPDGWIEFGVSRTYEDVLDWYKKYLGNYLKVAKLEKNPNNEFLLVHFNDGSVLQIETNIIDMEFYTEAKYIDTNLRKGGVNYFAFRIFPYRNGKYDTSDPLFQPYTYNWDGSIESLKNEPTFGCYTSASVSKFNCAKLIQLNGWKIPKDYPWKF